MKACHQDAPDTDLPTYYHGGPIGRQKGAFLLPPTITKAASTADYGAAAVCRRDRVYITTEFNAALLFASGSRHGVVYVVEPVGQIEPDPDCSQDGLSFACERARIVRIIKPSHRDIQIARHGLALA